MRVGNSKSNTTVIIRHFNEPPKQPRPREKDDLIEEIQLLRMNFTATTITLHWDFAQRNRVLNKENAEKFLSVSFQGLRFPRDEDAPPAKASEAADYIEKVLGNGIQIGDKVFNFFGHSNSQLKEKTCLMYNGSKTEIWAMINRLGDFSKLTSVAKRAKRQGLLFSSSQPVFPLPWNDYPIEDDIEEDGQNFTDGCGYISKDLMRRVSRKLKLCFNDEPFLPSVVQIRYRGFKGVLALNPAIETDVVFRKSMDKFPCNDDSFCVVEASRPYVYGKLNQQIVALLSALGISDVTLTTVQQEHYQRLDDMFENPVVALKILTGEGKMSLSGELLEKGFTPNVTKALQSVKSRIIKASVKNKNTGESKPKLSIVVEHSRFVFAVADPNENDDERLKENEIYFAPIIDGEATPITGNVMLVRNPCMFPGDILIRRAVENAGCRHLVDCAVFAVRGRRATASCSGGGDLDGDKFTVVWDPRLVPTKMQAPYDYPPAGEKQKLTIGLDDMIKYFAQFNNASLGRIDALFWKWARVRPEGALSDQCVRLNVCFASAVDGERVAIPSDLKDERIPPFNAAKKIPIWEKMLVESQRRYENYKKEITQVVQMNSSECLSALNPEIMQDIVRSSDMNINNFQLMIMVYNWWYRYQTSRNEPLSDRSLLEELLFQIDFFDFSHAQKRQANDLGISRNLLENALTRSHIIPLRELEIMQLDLEKFHWKLYYSSFTPDHTGYDRLFMQNLSEALCDYTRTMVVLQYSDEFSVALYFPQKLKAKYNRQAGIGDAVCFQFINGQVEKLLLTEYWTVYIGGDRMQLFQGSEAGDTLIWLQGQRACDLSSNEEGVRIGYPESYNKRVVKVRSVVPGAALPVDRPEDETVHLMSIAVKNSRWFPHGLTDNMDFIRKERLTGVELYVVSNRVPPKLRTLSVANTHIPVQAIPPPEVADFDAPSFDYPEPEHAELVAKLKRFRDEGHIPLEKKADSFMPLIRILHYYGQTETTWCYKLVDKVLELYPSSITADSEVFQILLYMPRMADKFSQHLANISPGVCVKLICALLQTGSIAPQQTVLDKVGILLARMESVEDGVFSAADYCKLLKASVLTLDPDFGKEFIELLFGDPGCLVGYDYLKKFGRLLCLDLLGERGATVDGQTNEMNKKKAQTRISLSDNSKKQTDDPENGTKKKDKFNYRVENADKPRVGDIVRFKRMNKPKESLSTDELVCMLGVIVDISPDILVRFDFAPPAEIELAKWELEVVGNSTTFNYARDALCTFVTEQAAATEAYGEIMGMDAEQPVEEDCGREVERFIKGLNESQRKAVRTAYASCNKLTVVQGPPGTGKTHMIVDLLRALMAKYGKCQVLAVASTNTAADNILGKIVATYKKQYPGQPFAPVRIGDKSAVAKDLQPYALENLAEGRTRPERKKSQEKKLQEADLVVSTCTGAGLADLKKLRFSVVVIDEASQLTEPCALIAIVKAQRVVLVGDHKQLPPQVHKLAIQDVDMDLSVSLFDRLARMKGAKLIMLNEHYRCHPFIITFPSAEFYGGELKPLVTPQERPLPAGFNWPDASKPVVLLDIDGKESCRSGGSKYNEMEAKVVVCLLKKLLCLNDQVAGGVAVQAREVGVVSAYKDQVNLLKNKVRISPKLKKFAKDIDIVTVDGFQGKEKDVIIFSAVRCRDDGSIGFLADERRFNVLMTRARRGVMVVASVKTLKASKVDEQGTLWRKWVGFAETHGLRVDGQQYVERA